MMRLSTLLRRHAAALGLLAVFTASFAIGCASGSQPHMGAALDALRVARSELRAATNDKGGHRQNALELVERAINQVEAGMRYDARH